MATHEEKKECTTCHTQKVSNPTPDGDEVCPNCGDREMIDSTPPSRQGWIEEAKLFHDTYEELALSFGYFTREETRKWNPESDNGRLMIAVVEKVLSSLLLSNNQRLVEGANHLRVLRVPNDPTPEKPLSNENYTEYVRLSAVKALIEKHSHN